MEEFLVVLVTSVLSVILSNDLLTLNTLTPKVKIAVPMVCTCHFSLCLFLDIVREKAKYIIDLLGNEEQIKEMRDEAQRTRDRYSGLGSSAADSGSYSSHSASYGGSSGYRTTDESYGSGSGSSSQSGWSHSSSSSRNTSTNYRYSSGDDDPMSCLLFLFLCTYFVLSY